MDFSKIRLVVTDMDGTLLNKNHDVSERFYKQFEALEKKNIHFVAASGRQYQSILNKLSPIHDKISIIGENGGIMQHNNETNILLSLSKDNVAECIKTLREIDRCYIVLCGRKAAYIESKDRKFFKLFKNYYSEIKIVQDLLKVIDDNFLKIAVFHFKSTEKFIYPYAKDFEDKYQVIVSGQNWLDISHKQANKAYALKILQEKMGITPEETIVFGDYNNDLEMLKLAEMSFAMENAHPEVKKIAKYTTKSNNNEGVEDILEKLVQF
jgi:hypothetical protein